MGSRALTAKLFAFALCLCWAVGARADCTINHLDIRGDWGQVRFVVQVADDPAERSLGLMHVESMPRFSGMLFVYDAPQRVAFWMKNTLIPLDMIFVDQHGVVQKIHSNAVPMDLTPIPGGDAIKYVLEVNGGLSQQLGIAVGSQLRHPAIANAVWPCP